MSDENITHVKREIVYVEGGLSFEEGRWRRDNPYSSSSPTLQQVWWNGWDHGRRIKQRERSPRDEHIVRPLRVDTGMKTIPEVTPPLKRMRAYAEGRKAFEEKRWRAFNPYKEIHEELASDWWNGWDQAKEESTAGKDDV